MIIRTKTRMFRNNKLISSVTISHAPISAYLRTNKRSQLKANTTRLHKSNVVGKQHYKQAELNIRPQHHSLFMSPGVERRPNAPSYRRIIRNTVFRHITLKFTTPTEVESLRLWIFKHLLKSISWRILRSYWVFNRKNVRGRKRWF